MDRATMAYGLEARSPLLDHALTAEVATLHPDLLFDRAAGKAILRAAYADMLPPEILARPKMGFGVPLADWLQTDLRSNVHDLLLSDSAPLGEILRRDRVRALVDGRCRDGREPYRVWNLLALAGWANARGIA
jgi:asparagine synthase (glutamine-hydrolysing)